MFFFGVKGVGDVLAGLFEQVVDVFFFGVKGVGDVLAGLCLAFTCSSLVSRASMTRLLDVVELFVLVKGVGDVLPGRGAGC